MIMSYSPVQSALLKVTATCQESFRHLSPSKEYKVQANISALEALQSIRGRWKTNNRQTQTANDREGQKGDTL